MTDATVSSGSARSVPPESWTPGDWVGQPTGPARTAPDPVNAPMIRHWLQAMLFLDDQRLTLRYGESSTAEVAPLTMLQVWAHHDRRYPEPAGAASNVTRFEQELERAGFTGVLGVASDQQYARLVRVGERLTMQGSIHKISELKQTSLGPGRFITFRYEYRDEDSRSVGTIDMTSLRYRPAATDGADGPASERPVMVPDADIASRPAAASFPELAGAAPRPGIAFPDAVVPVTSTTVVAGALATRDFYPVHHDLEFAWRSGSAGLVMSIMTSLGLAERALHGWLGSTAGLRSVRLRLGSPCHPGDVLTFSGSVQAPGAAGQPDEASKSLLTVDVTAATARGTHLSAVVSLARETGGGY
jgi:acyl dehydratase